VIRRRTTQWPFLQYYHCKGKGCKKKFRGFYFPNPHNWNQEELAQECKDLGLDSNGNDKELHTRILLIYDMQTKCVESKKNN